MSPVKVLDEPGAETILRGNAENIQDLPAVIMGPCVFSRWRLSDEERAAITTGADILLATLSGGQPLQPLLPLTLKPEIPLTEEQLKNIAIAIIDGE